MSVNVCLLISLVHMWNGMWKIFAKGAAQQNQLLKNWELKSSYIILLFA